MRENMDLTYDQEMIIFDFDPLQPDKPANKTKHSAKM